MGIFAIQKKFFIKNLIGENWKQSDEKYIRALEKFLDRASNIKDEELRESVINNMLVCDQILTQNCETQFVKLYKKAYKEGKKNKLFKKEHNNREKNKNKKVV